VFVSCGHSLGGCGVVAVRNMVASWCSAASCSSPSFANGAAGAGLRSLWMRSKVNLVMVSVDERRGMDHCSGKFDCAAGEFRGCFGGLKFVASVLVGSWSHIPALFTVCDPCAILGRCFMEDNLGAGPGGAIGVLL
jgi:hypothetical protein